MGNPNADPAGPSSPSRPRSRRRPRQLGSSSTDTLPHHPRAVALVTVLMMVALLTLLVVSLLAISSQHQKGATLYSTGIEVRQLSDLAVNTAIGQIRQATLHPSDPAGHAPWVSQPGAIRTWSTSGPEKLFKLYSSKEMVVDISSEGVRAALLAHEADLLASFDPSPDAPTAVRARLTDLNEPVTTSSSDGTTGLHFPIVDPRAALDTDPVEGFSFDPTAVPGTSDDPADPALPMPVEWLYVLRDGSLGTLDPDTLSYSGQGTPSRSNPIVGRIAFWTDDESSKINVNTASEPIPWDTPRADTTTERNYASRPPVANEVQRFPGHPATTALSPVLFPGRYAGQVIPPTAAQLTDQQLKAIYDLAPRVNYTDASGAEAGALGGNRRAIAFDDDRLYASFDEILFSTSRDENLIPLDRLRRSRFFLTTSSRAPETNIHGLPRVCLWPVDARVPNDLSPSNLRTSYDELAAFASTLAVPEGARYDEQGTGLAGTFGKGAYHYQRIAPYSYIWGHYGTSSNSDGASSHRPRRNAQLIEYLFELTRRPIPGHGGSLDEKYGNSATFTGTHSISRRNAYAAIQSQFGYTRTLNLFDTTFISPGRRVTPFTSSQQSRGYVSSFHSLQPVGANTAYQEYLARGSSVSVGGPLLAIGRHHAYSELALVLSCTAVRTASGQFSGAPGDQSRVRNGQKMIDLAILPEWFCPGQGFPMLAYRSRTLLKAISGEIRWEAPGGVTGRLPLALANFNTVLEHPFVDDDPTVNLHPEKVLWGGSGGPEWPMARQLIAPIFRGFALRDTARFLIPADATRLELVDVKIQIDNREPVNPGGWNDENRRLQAYHFEFPTTKVPVPNYDPALGTLTTYQNRITGLNNGLPYGTADSPGIHATSGKGGIIRGDDTDVVRSLVVGHGDYRLITMIGQPGRFGMTGTRYAAQQLFAPSHGYFEEDRFLAHALVGAGGHSRRYPGTTLPLDRNISRSLSLVPDGAPHPPDRQPDLPLLPGEDGFAIQVPPSWRHAVDPALTRDWDNGFGPAPDGAYWNLPDSGARQGPVPYFNPLARDFGTEPSPDEESFSPNRLIASPVSFGSIPSLPLSYVPWTTFLFRPDLTPSPGHFGSANNSLSGALPGAPPDHLWLDLYWMPVVQPYAISEPFSTAGKINLNYQILPFSHIRRATGLHAALKSEELLAIPSTAAPSYKTGAGNAQWRHRIDPVETLSQFDDRFSSGDLFLTESELCELFLVPFGQTVSSMPSFWQAHALTGDNTLEKPYANLYPRLTTRSNSFRVHFKVQTLQLARSSRPDSFDPDLDLVTGEFQGATVVERYLEPKDPAIPDYVHQVLLTRSLDDLPSLDQFYRFRVLETRRFAP